jgi:predicted dehydrogenase
VNSLKVGVVGVGYLGQHHTRVYRELHGVELCGVSDTDPERGRNVAEEYGTTYYPEYRDLLQSIDAVSVAVPTYAHRQVAGDALAMGVHTLVEKPIAKTVTEADELVRLAREKSVVLQVGHIERFNPAIIAINDLVSEPLFIETHRLAPFNPRGTDVPVVLDLMVHDLDIVLHFVQCPVLNIDAVGVPILTPAEDIANARLEFENGCIANLTASRVSREKQRKIRLFQKDSYISVDCLERTVECYWHTRDENGSPQIERRDPEVLQDDPLELELKSFIDSIINDSRPSVTGEDGRNALDIAHQIMDRIDFRKHLLKQRGIVPLGMQE